MSLGTADHKLIKACKKGDNQAQKELYDLFAPKMMVIALRYSKSVPEAEDILQDAFVKVFQKIGSLKQDDKLGGWIKRIVINTALNQNRSKLYMFPMSQVEENTISDESEINLSEIHFQELLKMIQALPLGCQTIFNLYAIEGYSHSDIAKKLGISSGTSKSQYSRARKILREKLESIENVNYGAV